MRYIFNFSHIPVLLKESIKALNINKYRSNGIYIDCTFGGGGHTIEILKHLGKKGKIIAFDKDPISVINSKFIKDSRFSIYNTSFINLEKILLKNNINYVDGILMDLGISTMQINDINRGFSFKLNAPLDMRMNNKKGISAQEFLLNAKENFIFKIFKKYGEEKNAFKIAKNIVIYRKYKPILTTFQLLEIIQNSIKNNCNKKRSFIKIFQAIRIYINRELDDLKNGLEIALNKISVNGRIVVISFHSLEDKIVKKFMQSKIVINKFYNCIPILNINFPKPKFKLFHKVKPSIYEIFSNSNSRTAIMRCIERINI